VGRFTITMPACALRLKCAAALSDVVTTPEDSPIGESLASASASS